MKTFYSFLYIVFNNLVNQRQFYHRKLLTLFEYVGNLSLFYLLMTLFQLFLLLLIIQVIKRDYLINIFILFIFLIFVKFI
jgi:hypothetical protein